MDELLALVKDISPYLTVPLLILVAGAVTLVWNRTEELLRQQVDLERAVSATKDERLKVEEARSSVKDDHIKMLNDKLLILLAEKEKPTEIQATIEILQKDAERRIEAAQSALKAAMDELAKRNTEMSQFRAAYDQVLSSSSDLQSMHQIQRTYLGRVTHEFRAPLSSISASSDLLIRRGEDISEPKRRRLLESIQLSARHLSELLFGLDVSRGTGSRDLEHRERSNLCADVVLPVLEHMKDRWAEEGVYPQVSLEGCENVPPMLINRQGMRMLFTHLLENAVKYNKPDHSCKIAIALASAEGKVEASISSYGGIGVPEEDSERIFQAGYRAPNATRHTVTGLGLGLAVARQIARSHGGELDLVEQADPTTFRLQIPIGAITAANTASNKNTSV